MINLIIFPETEKEDFPAKLIFPFNTEEEIRLAIEATVEIVNAGVMITTKIEEDLLDKECEL